MRGERLRDAALTVAFVATASYLSTSAFTSKSRREILQRDGNMCRECGATDHLEAAHIDHNKKKKNYDSPSNGRTLCTEHHLDDHIDRHGRNGLTPRQNRWAIKTIAKRLYDRSEVIYQADTESDS
ncbi:MAG: HNH endonuclease [Candidatus Riesia sp.]|nr:HNH endonuclease [Candidatus Riesia sp.]